MKQISRTSLLSGVGLLALALSMPINAAVSWNFSGSGQNINNGTLLGSDGATTATIKGYSNTNDISGEDSIETVQNVRRFGGGLGVCSNDDNCSSSGPHATDNGGDSEFGGDTDMILFSFNNAIDLDTVSVGWWTSDSDITVLAYTGAGVPASLVGELYSNLPSGWSFIGNYGDVGNQPGDTVSVNAANVSASHWLIGAYNPLISNSGWSTGNDAMKISAISASAGHNVPEPASMTLMLIGFTAFGFTRRRKKQA